MFLFWMLWPYIIVSMTQVIFRQFTGKIMPKSEIETLKRELGGIGRGRSRK